MTKPFKIHDPADSEIPPEPQPTGRLCPFRSAAIPMPAAKHPITGQQGVAIQFVSGPCVRECAGYDQAGDRNCFERGFAVVAALRPAFAPELGAGPG